MRPLSRAVLARDAASSIEGGACVGAARTWTELEVRHNRVETPAEARVVIAEVRGRFCGPCPARTACGRWAEIQQYSGLASGRAFKCGIPMPLGWVPPKAGARRRRRRAAG